jgi:hypothetical protein
MPFYNSYMVSTRYGISVSSICSCHIPGPVSWNTPQTCSRLRYLTAYILLNKYIYTSPNFLRFIHTHKSEHEKSRSKVVFSSFCKHAGSIDGEGIWYPVTRFLLFSSVSSTLFLSSAYSQMQPNTHDFSFPLVTSCNFFVHLLITLKETAISGKHNNNNNTIFISTKPLATRMHLISNTGASVPVCFTLLYFLQLPVLSVCNSKSYKLRLNIDQWSISYVHIWTADNERHYASM